MLGQKDVKRAVTTLEIRSDFYIFSLNETNTFSTKSYNLSFESVKKNTLFDKVIIKKYMKIKKILIICVFVFVYPAGEHESACCLGLLPIVPAADLKS